MTTEFYTRERCYITEMLNAPDDPEVSLARCRVPAGVTTELHKLSVTERYIVVSGQGLMRVGKAHPQPLIGGDTVHIAAGVAQQITNTGDTDLIFMCVCTPQFTPDCYVSLEN